MNKLKDIQKILFPDTPREWDGIWGPKSQAALNEAIENHGWRRVLGSSFADPADISAFKRCKQNGGTDRECFKKGDNAIGLWGDSTAAGTGPSCALPPEIWRPFYNTARKKRVAVRRGTELVVCELKDTMPQLANISNGAGIDLNPDAGEALGLHPPFLTTVEWKWWDEGQGAKG
jgi:hypothetical protein